MFNLDSKDLFEISLKYEDLVSSSPKLTNEQRLIIRALMLTQSMEKTIFITEESKENILKGYMILKKEFETKRINNEMDTRKANPSEKTRREQINRNEAIPYLINCLTKNNSNLIIENKSYNSITASLNNKVIKIKIKLSNNFSETHHKSWHKEDKYEISKYDYHIYLVGDENNELNKYKTLLFTTQEIEDLISKKQLKENRIIHYNFEWDENGCVYDVREKKPLDVTFADADSMKHWKLR
jgi:hypothetical protein